MLKLNARLGGLLGICLLVAPVAFGQGLGNAPYSRIGLGEPTFGAGLTRNQAMGGTGVAVANNAFVNEINPALVFYTGSVTFDVGVVGQLKKLESITQAQRDGDVALSNFALALPISKWWGATIGLRPLTAVDYLTNSRIKVTGDSNGVAEARYQGEGGIAQAYMAHGFKVANGWTVGGEASYVFGAIESNTSTQLLAGSGFNGSASDRTVVNERRRYGDFLFRAGSAYRLRLKDKLNLNFGAAYQFERSLHVTSRRAQERRSLNDAILESLLLSDSVRTRATLPQKLTMGLGLDNNRNKTLSLDFEWQPWTDYRADGVALAALHDAWRLGVGGEITPDAASVESYFKRVTYRVGGYYAQLPYADKTGNQLRDAGLTWGFAFPLGKSAITEAANVQTAFAIGRRGTTDNAAIQETYVRMQVGLSLNNTWFVKRRIE